MKQSLKKFIVWILHSLGIINGLQAFLASLELEQDYPEVKKVKSKCNLKLRKK